MNSHDDRFLPSAGWRDPRNGPDFLPELWPGCDGGGAPPIGTQDPVERRKLEFLAAYYVINRAYAQLEAAPESERRAAVLALDAALSARDQLEDRYAPIGFLGTPERMEGVLALELFFMRSPDEAPRSPAVASSAFAFDPGMEVPAEAARRKLDTAGFQQFLEQQLTSPDGETHP